MHLPELPTIFVKGGEERQAFFTIQAKELIAAGWVQKGTEKPAEKKAAAPKATPKPAPKAEPKPEVKAEEVKPAAKAEPKPSIFSKPKVEETKGE